MGLWDFFTGRRQKKAVAPSPAKEQGKPPLAMVSVSAERAEGYDEDFMAEHFEGLGDIWGALFGDGDSIVAHLREVLEQGKSYADCRVVYDDKTMAALLQYPDQQKDIRVGALVAGAPESGKMEFYSGFPVMEGLSNSLKIRKRHTWGNGVEGVVAAEQANDGPPISFFAPFYFRDFAAFAPEAELTVSLAALALSCEKAEVQEFTVNEGPLYEMVREKFLKENPGKSEADFSAPVVSMRGARISFPRPYACEWEYRCPVLSVERTSLLGMSLYKLRVIFAGTDEQELSGYLYIPEHQLKGYVPQAGDDIQGVLWMTGALGSPAG